MNMELYALWPHCWVLYAAHAKRTGGHYMVTTEVVALQTQDSTRAFRQVLLLPSAGVASASVPLAFVARN